MNVLLIRTTFERRECSQTYVTSVPVGERSIQLQVIANDRYRICDITERSEPTA